MLDSMISTMSSNYMSYLGSGVVPRPMGTAFPTVVPYRVFHARDRAIAIAVGSEKLWAAFCRAIERPDLEKHPDYESNAARIRNRAVLEPLLEEACSASGPRQSGSSACKAAGIPASLVRNFRGSGGASASGGTRDVSDARPCHGRTAPGDRDARQAFRHARRAGRAGAAAGRAHRPARSRICWGWMTGDRRSGCARGDSLARFRRIAATA